jgi:4-amino-4-deoxy-L-arabinose transferase-like glycosyltransferase
MPSAPSKPIWQLLLLAGICLCSFFTHLNVHDVDLMEARNFVTAREMIVDGNWWVPTMNGEIRISKPPLPTWLTAITRIGLGNRDDNAVMRLPAAIAASLLVFFFWGFMRSLSDDPLLPLFSAAVAATSFMVIEVGRRGTWDIHCHSYMLLALWALSSGWNHKDSALGRFCLAGIGMALSFMSKGPVSFYTLLIPFTAAYIYAFGFTRVGRKWKELLLALMVLIILSASWPAYVYFHYPEISAAVAKTETAAWGSRHARPFYFYAPFAIYTGLWASVVLAGFVKPYASRKINAFGSYRFIITWTIVSIVFLSIIPEKKERYLLPAMIPLAGLAGYLFRSLMQSFQDRSVSRGDKHLFFSHALLTGAGAALIPIAIFIAGVSKGNLSTPMAVAWSCAFWVMASLVYLAAKRRWAGYLFTTTVVITCLINISILPLFYRSALYRRNPDYESFTSIRLIPEIKGLPIYYHQIINLRRVWKAGQPIKPWEPNAETVLANSTPVVIISETPHAKIESAIQLGDMTLSLVDTIRFDPKDPKRIKYIYLLSPARANLLRSPPPKTIKREAVLR